MASSPAPHGGLEQLASLPRFSLAQLPTPIHRLENFVRHAGDIDLWIKRDDLTGLVGGGNKTRKLEFLIGDAKGAAEHGLDTLATLTMPDLDATVAPLVYALPIQLIAYHTAVFMGKDVDQPRSLAKSVTVE